MKVEQIEKNKFIIKGNNFEFWFFVTREMLNSFLNKRFEKDLLEIDSHKFLNSPVVFLPDVHLGYYFPIGTVLSTKNKISPLGIGKDIGCGVSLSLIDLKFDDISEKIWKKLFLYLKQEIGIESNKENFFIKKNLVSLMEKGVSFFSDYNLERESYEDGGFKKTNFDINFYNNDKIIRQLGTIGGGNHFLEISYISECEDSNLNGKIACLIHTGSRGFGASIFEKISFPAFVDFDSTLGKKYLNHYDLSINFAFLNRKILLDKVNKFFEKNFKKKFVRVIDHIHNSFFHDKTNDNFIHRKGASKIFDYHKQNFFPNIIPGNMLEGSYLILAKKFISETYDSICHGAGRNYSRRQAMKKFSLKIILQQMKKRKIYTSATERALKEESSFAYKDLDEILKIVEERNWGKKMYRLLPKIVIKG